LTSSPFREGDFVWCAFPERENPVRPGPLHLAYTLAVVAAAVGKFPGTTPEEMPAEITWHRRFTAEEFNVRATEQPHWRARPAPPHPPHIEDAERFIAERPGDAVGVVFLDGGRPVQPDVTALDNDQRNPGAPRGLWPSSAEISGAMLERYGKPKP
jgi:hypothetical protein